MPALEQVRIGVSPLTDRIYIGTVSKKDPTLWLSKVDATSQFIANLLTWTEPGTVRTVVGNDGSEFEITVKRTKPANVAGNRLAEGKSELTGLLGGPTRSEKD